MLFRSEYGKESTRGPSELTSKQESKGLDMDYAFDWSYGIGESFTMLVPDFMGGASSSDLKKNSALYSALQERQSLGALQQAPLYWGDQSYTAGPVYMGAIMVFLFLVGFILVKNEYKWWLVIATVLFMIMSWGKNMLSINEL